MMTHKHTFLALTPLLVATLCVSVVFAQNWETMPCPVTTPLKGIWGTESDNIYAVGSEGVILRYNGSSWSSIANLGTTAEFRGIHGSSAASIVAVGTGGTVLQYNGASWSKRSLETSGNLNAVWMHSSQAFFIAGENGIILECDASSCSQSSFLTSYSLNGIWGVSQNDVYAVGGGGTILHFNGTGWTAMTSNTTETLYAIWGTSASDIYAAGGGVILHFNGTVWTPLKAVKRDYYALSGISSPFRVYAASKDGKISYYEGSSWSDMVSGTTKALQGLWVSEINEAFAVGAGGTILKYSADVLPENSAPEASFTISVSTDNPLTVYVDASASSDVQTASEDLQVQWDWQNDGSFDTQYTTTKTASHTYPAAGAYTITLRVRDEDYYTATASKQIVLEPAGPGQCPAQQVLGTADPRLQTLRCFRDAVLARSSSGRLLINVYYRTGGMLSGILADNPSLAELTAQVIDALLPLAEPCCADR